MTPEEEAREIESATSTVYVILAKSNDTARPNTWDEIGHMKATSSDQAIRRHGQSGTYVAIPQRSFQARAVRTETKTVLKVEDA